MILRAVEMRSCLTFVWYKCGVIEHDLENCVDASSMEI